MGMKFNILIVDDIKENIYSLKVLLERLQIEDKDFAGFNIYEALSGEDALGIILREKIDLILLDVRMPVMDGFEFDKILKSREKTKNIPIVFLTAEFKSDEFLKKGYEIGALDYFTKPIEEVAFLSKIKLYVQLFLSTKIKEKVFDDTLSDYTNLMDKHVLFTHINLDGKITNVSKAYLFLTGYSKSEVIGQVHNVIKTPRDGDKHIWDTISKNRVWKGKIKNQKKNGDDYWFEVFISPKYNRYREKIGYILINHDITTKILDEY